MECVKRGVLSYVEREEQGLLLECKCGSWLKEDYLPAKVKFYNQKRNFGFAIGFDGKEYYLSSQFCREFFRSGDVIVIETKPPVEKAYSVFPLVPFEERAEKILGAKIINLVDEFYKKFPKGEFTDKEFHQFIEGFKVPKACKNPENFGRAISIFMGTTFYVTTIRREIYLRMLNAIKG